MRKDLAKTESVLHEKSLLWFSPLGVANLTFTQPSLFILQVPASKHDVDHHCRMASFLCLFNILLCFILFVCIYYSYKAKCLEYTQ
jgi:hypothetical protein